MGVNNGKTQPWSKTPGNCKYCSRELEKRRRYGPKFCNKLCEDKFKRNQIAAGEIVPTLKDSTQLKATKALAFDNLYDPVRDTVREEIRQTISQHVKDNVLGMTEMLSDLLPMVLAGLARDLQSDDVFVRQKAQALTLKYVMPLQKEDVATEDSRVLNVIHRVAVPDTILGEAVEAELASLPAGVERFEADWPECYQCHERKNPETGVYNGGTRQPDNWLCNACKWRNDIKAGVVNQIADERPEV